jgi:phosphomannomutase
MKRFISVITLFVVTLLPAMGLCGDHLVSPRAAEKQLAQNGAQRGQDTLIVLRALSTPAAASTAATLGLALDRVKTGVPTLSSHELRDLAARASMLGTDPAGGYHEHDPVVHDFLVIFLIAATVAVVLAASGH